MKPSETLEVSLFPIPGCVCFPFSKVPLHVFEPRYRQMIKDCLDNDRMIAVSHTKGRIGPDRPNEPLPKSKNELYEQLNKNLKSYHSQEIFSAGICELLETTEDGRLMVQIRMSKRLAYRGDVQTVPYRIVKCEEFFDENELSFIDLDNHQTTKNIILDTLRPMFEKDEELNNYFVNNLITENSINDFTFKVFQFIKLDEAIMQELLESRDPVFRLGVLNSVFKTVKAQS